MTPISRSIFRSRPILRSVRSAMIAGSAALALAAASAGAAWAAGTLRIGMTASDIPLTTGQTDQGGEGQRVMGYTLYNALIEWDLSSAEKAATLIPSLATSWDIDPTDQTKWTFKLRDGVKFHDGSRFDANAVVWNLDKLLKSDAPQFDKRQSAQGKSRIPAVASYKVIDPLTVEIVTKTPDATLPYQISWILMSSPANWEAQGKNWDAVAQKPSGTGPWKLENGFTPRERAELTPNADYWDKARIPKLDKLVLIPLPEPNTRVAALRSGQVDWIEAPAPDSVASLRDAGFKIVTNSYPHNWTWHLSRVEGSPWNDIRVRKAANLAVDREGLNELLGGLSIPAQGYLPPGSPWFGNPTFKLSYNVEEAKKLMAEAGYGPDKPITTKVVISSSGSGQMLPLQMNEYIQQTLAEIGINVEFEVADWNTVINIWRAGAKDPSAKGATAVNYSYFIQDPFTALIRQSQCNLAPPAGTNWGYYCDPEMDELFAKVRTTFDPVEQNKVLQQIHEKYVNEALFLMVTHDVNPRAMTEKVKGFVQAQNWFQDFSTISVDP
ncbi:ABC-type transport system substrate-binding protein [Rhizobium sp. PP-F2F-G38]|uniref:ABC transporter substrate-binding protein n=2 Tax=Hyphomicrobiales TaxID=356 RepID=A0AA43ZDH3_9HYPH|nr:ABC transporter substrate-binding protein [Ferranicluibacter rubi]PYE32513.1 ABC-type transport system substrate-binding protein [Rhizobium sp. PP-WC-1G-195]PYE95942.1 ABC-type transport system substrate-binding protein [Rhizobium sp. PP-F2F-G38]TCP88453.1 ABC-type transport system substrate-binding protein [Rhizobium sp. PP-CC-2G-626]TCQ22882.1 ABC-type transport system substrate-binding protein [Rhizobium sp. PP-CC-3G-465]